MPDMVSKDHSSSMQASQASPPTPKAQSQTTPPAPKPDQAKPQPPTPPQAPQPKADPQKTKPMDATKPPPPKVTPAPTKTPPQPAFDENGLPVLPALSAPTMAPQTTTSTQQQQQVATSLPVPQIVPANMQGLAGMSGQPTPEAMKTALGAYKARFYAAVGSQWYSKLTPDKIQLIGVGSVLVHYTIYKDGTIKTWVVANEANNSSSTILLPISETSIRAVSPFIPFPPAMEKEVGDSYSDSFTFSIYSN